MYFQRAMSGRASDWKPDDAERGGDGLGDVVDAGRPPADVEDGDGVPGRRLHDARLEVGRRRHHRHGVDGRPPAQERPLVGHAVLQADDRRVGQGALGERLDHARRVLALDADDDDVVGSERQLRRVGDDRDRERHGVLRPLDGQPALGDGRAVGTPGHEHHVVAVLEHAPADDAPDGPGPVDDPAHGQTATGS